MDDVAPGAICDEITACAMEIIPPKGEDVLDVIAKKTKKKWPNVELKIDKNQSYDTSHIIVTTGDLYEKSQAQFALACIHAEHYLLRRNRNASADQN